MVESGHKRGDLQNGAIYFSGSSSVGKRFFSLDSKRFS